MIVLVRTLFNRTLSPKPISLDDVESSRMELEAFSQKMARKAQSIVVETTFETYEDNPSFNLWAKILLSLFANKNWWFLQTPQIFHSNIDPQWQQTIRPV